MDDKLRDKLAKIYELVNRGATEGERQAAKNVLDRIIDAHGIDESELENLDKKTYVFKYKTSIELSLLGTIMRVLTDESVFHNSYRINIDKKGRRVKQVESNITYLEWVTVESSYEYFRRHMKAEWNKVVYPLLNKKRKISTKNAARKRLEPIFLNRYVIASKLYKEDDLTDIDMEAISYTEAKDRAMMMKVEGGVYNKQVISNLLLEN